MLLEHALIGAALDDIARLEAEAGRWQATLGALASPRFAVLLGGDIAPGIDLRLAFGKSVLLAIIGGWSVVVKEVSRYRLLKAVQRADNPLANRTQAFLERRDR